MENNTEETRSVERIQISRAVPGMELARDVYSRNGQVILNAGNKLDAQKISKIMFYSVDSVAVYADEEQEESALSDQLKSSATFMEFSRKYDSTVNKLKDSIEKVVRFREELDEDLLLGEIDSIVEVSGSKTGIFNMLHCIREYDEVTYTHCVNVALIANCFAQWLHMSEEEIRLLTLSGLLHDVGKTLVPKSIIMKPDTLTDEEYQVMKTHTVLGYDALRDKKIDDRVKMVALQHHERADGTGYPFGKTADDIEPFSMIIAIADVYDAMTSERAYRPAICPFDVMKNLQDDALSKYSPRFMVPILEQIAEVYINHTVRLSDDKVGKVVLLNRQEIARPTIQVGDLFVDLSRQRNVQIKEVL